MIANDSKDDLVSEFSKLDDEANKDEAKKEKQNEIFSFTVAPGIFGEMTVSNFSGEVVLQETSIGVNMAINSETYIKLLRASSAHAAASNRGRD